jgi:hypothetical protein
VIPAWSYADALATLSFAAGFGASGVGIATAVEFDVVGSWKSCALALPPYLGEAFVGVCAISAGAAAAVGRQSPRQVAFGLAAWTAVLGSGGLLYMLFGPGPAINAWRRSSWRPSIRGCYLNDAGKASPSKSAVGYFVSFAG